ncbi:uncharacterized protein [Cherax quadricarinatus]|uniref:uncharacterized protein isoform X1 n=1 Tax=Cherax quadricarinatus TaxID=27406 RepID=UPI002377F772|nr:uncharacterized protein LOC128700132 isoform X2 [Cherax quadricarinatus]
MISLMVSTSEADGKAAMNFLPSVGSLVLLLFLFVQGLCDDCVRECHYGDYRICTYQFHVQEYHTLSRACYQCPDNAADCYRQDCIPADGVARPLLAVNRQLPGPAIQVCEGDRVVVDVFNDQLSDTETIHWHGHHMRRFQYYDGVPFITQCPIQKFFRYDFLATTPGTHWWHSHTGVHRAEGVFGAFVVRQTQDLYLDTYDVDSPDHVLVLQDWLHKSALEKFSGRHHHTQDDFASAILINGKGRNYTNMVDGFVETKTPLEVVMVTPKLRHRLRLINAGSLNCPLVVSVDNHTLTIIATDGEKIVPFTTNSLVIYSGERFDVVLKADQPVGNYWIRVNGLIDCEQNKCVQGAVLRYDGAPDNLPSAQLSFDSNYPPGVVVNPLNSGGASEEEVTLVELDAFKPSILKEKVDKQFFLAFNFNRINNSLLYHSGLYPYNGVTKEWHINSPQVNNLSFKAPLSPPLSQPMVQQPFCYYGEEPPCDGDYCSCTYVLEVALGETVEMVLVDEGTIGDENHPFHLHGYNFHVVAMERLGSETTVEEVKALDAAGGIKRKLKNPVKKDSVTIPDGGYTIVRFTADNPGKTTAVPSMLLLLVHYKCDHSCCYLCTTSVTTYLAGALQL